jgi:hypothetical protein
MVDVTEPPQSPVFCGTPQKMRPKKQAQPTMTGTSFYPRFTWGNTLFEHRLQKNL